MRTTDEPSIEYMNLTALVAADKNPKRHDRGTIKASIRRFGFVAPLILNEATGRLVEGHGRLECLHEMRAAGEPPPKRIGSDASNMWLVPVVRGLSFNDENEAQAYLIAANRLVELGGWDSSEIAESLEQVRASSSLEGIGYSSRELDKLLARVAARRAEPKEVEIPSLKKAGTTITQAGDVWKLGVHRLICGDSTLPETWGALMLKNELAPNLIADPPYGMGKEKDGVANDNLTRERLDAFQTAWWAQARQYLTQTASAYVWGNPAELWRWYYGDLARFQAEAKEPLTFRNEIVWNKERGHGQGTDAHRMYPTVTERCLFFARGLQGFGNKNLDRYWPGYDPIRCYIAEQCEAAAVTDAVAKKVTRVRMFGHWTTRSQWVFIPEKHYLALREHTGGQFFTRPYADLRAQYEELQALQADWMNGERAFHDNAHETMSDVWSFEQVRGAERFGHATPKPVLMMVRSVKTSVPVGNIVADPFAGTGPVLMAAEQTERIYRGIELSPGYCDIVVERWESLTGGKARKA